MAMVVSTCLVAWMNGLAMSASVGFMALSLGVGNVFGGKKSRAAHGLRGPLVRPESYLVAFRRGGLQGIFDPFADWLGVALPGLPFRCR